MPHLPEFIVMEGKQKRVYRGLSKLHNVTEKMPNTLIILVQNKLTIDIWELHHPGAVQELKKYYIIEQPWVRRNPQFWLFLDKATQDYCQP